jgi:MoxR-like ATPase
MTNEITLNEFKEIFIHLLDNNKKLEDKGLRPQAIGVEGPPGIGKTSFIENIAQERGMTMCKLLLSQIEEQGDLIGLPIKEFQAQYIEDNEVKNTVWILEKQIKYLEDSYKLTGKVRMSYAPPAWLPEEENPNGTILLLDDFTRK